MTILGGIKKAGLLAALTAMALGGFGAGTGGSASAQDATMPSSALQRLTLVVSDIDRSVDFYGRIGLVAQTDTARSKDGPDGIIGGDSLPLTDDPTRSRLIIMKNPGGATGEIGLLWYDRPPLPSARSNLMGMGTGDVLLTFQVSDIAAVYDRLDAVSTRFQGPPVHFSERGDNDERRSGRRLLAYDPDGHIVEITQPD